MTLIVRNLKIWNRPLSSEEILDEYAASVTSSSSAICPDLLELDHIGVADNWRGRIVRSFFWILDKVWRPK